MNLGTDGVGAGTVRMTNYDTKLTPSQESDFQKWKSIYAPKDSGKDYDLRGAFKSGLTPDPKTGHWPDTFKKPNHPTFSNESIYAKDAPEKAGRWKGNTFIPPQRLGGTMAGYFPNAYSDYTDAQRKSMQLAQDRASLSSDAFSAKYPNAVPIGGRKSNYTTYQLPSGGTAQLPAGSPLPSGYQNATPYVPPRTAAQQFDLSQAYKTGYDAPTPTIQQGAGGPYRVAGGVAAPIQQPLFPNIFNNPAGNAVWNAGTRGLSAVGNVASNVFSGIGRAANTALQYNPLNPGFDYDTGKYYLPNTGPRPRQQQYAGGNAFYGYNPSPMPMKPNRYFDY